MKPAVCSHHWLIDPPGGPTSRGICHLCGAERDFRNTVSSVSKNTPIYKWDRETIKARHEHYKYLALVRIGF